MGDRAVRSAYPPPPRLELLAHRACPVSLWTMSKYRPAGPFFIVVWPLGCFPLQALPIAFTLLRRLSCSMPEDIPWDRGAPSSRSPLPYTTSGNREMKSLQSSPERHAESELLCPAVLPYLKILSDRCLATRCSGYLPVAGSNSMTVFRPSPRFAVDIARLTSSKAKRSVISSSSFNRPSR